MNTRIDNLTELLLQKLPQDLLEAQGDIRQNFKDVLTAKLEDWGLASAVDLKGLTKALHDSQQRIEELEARIESLEVAQGVYGDKPGDSIGS